MKNYKSIFEYTVIIALIGTNLSGIIINSINISKSNDKISYIMLIGSCYLLMYGIILLIKKERNKTLKS